MNSADCGAKTPKLLLVAALALVALAVACADNQGGPAENEGTPEVPTATAPASPSPPGRAEEEVTITGTVMDVSDVGITLEEAVQGFQIVALTADTRILTSDGAPATSQDIEAGTRIQATGQPAQPDALLATEIRILET